jgi:hypothetical protein
MKRVSVWGHGKEKPIDLCAGVAAITATWRCCSQITISDHGRLQY